MKGEVEGAGGATAESLPKVTSASAATARLAMQQFAVNGIDATPKTPYVPSMDDEYDPRFSGDVSSRACASTSCFWRLGSRARCRRVSRG